MRLACLPVLAAALLTAGAQPPHAPPPDDTRLSIHTLVREDVFAGVLDGDADRLARGERSIEALLERRPADKPGLLAWKGGATLYRAVVAHEAGRTREFRETYARAIDLLARAKKLGPTDPGPVPLHVARGANPAATGGTHTTGGDPSTWNPITSQWLKSSRNGPTRTCSNAFVARARLVRDGITGCIVGSISSPVRVGEHVCPTIGPHPRTPGK